MKIIFYVNRDYREYREYREYRIIILFKLEFKYFFCFERLRLKYQELWFKSDCCKLYNDKNKNINNSFTNTSIGCIMEFKCLIVDTLYLYFLLRL